MSTSSSLQHLPVAVIGAGPIGLAAAAHLVARGESPVVFEAGAAVGAAIREWGHVRLFSPWRYLVDRTARALLERTGWHMPSAEVLPLGRELVEQYLEPLAALPAMAAALRLHTEVVAISRRAHDKMKDADRAEAPFVIRVRCLPETGVCSTDGASTGGCRSSASHSAAALLLSEAELLASPAG
jgi:cation diffusion facilitator CzcD-associated flavoprotein CzcO